MIGYYANELNLDKEFGLKLLALKRAKTLKNCLGISFTEHDVMNELPEMIRYKLVTNWFVTDGTRISRSFGKRCKRVFLGTL